MNFIGLNKEGTGVSSTELVGVWYLNVSTRWYISISARNSIRVLPVPLVYLQTQTPVSARPDLCHVGQNQLLAMVIPAFGHGTKGTKFWLRLKPVPRFSPPP